MKISIPNPCTVPLWDMKPAKGGFYCDSCAKNVMDFRSWSKEDIQGYFKDAAHQKTCGIFKKEDVKAPPVIVIVPEVDATRLTVRQQFLYALLICFGTLFYSCNSNPANTPNNKETVTISHPYLDSLETKDSSQLKERVIIESNFDEDYPFTKKPVPEYPTGEDHTAGLPVVEYVNPPKFSPDSHTVFVSPSVNVPENVFTGFTVTEEPSFPGGEKAMARFLKKNIRYPAYEKSQKIEGTVYVVFTIMEDGHIANAKIEKGVEGAPNFDAEVLRVIQLMPKWKNQKINGKVYPYEYRLPIQFSL